jgi:hypothetical protein
MDLFIGRSLCGSPANAYRFRAAEEAMDRSAQVLAPNCRTLLVLVAIPSARPLPAGWMLKQ